MYLLVIFLIKIELRQEPINPPRGMQKVKKPSA